MVVAGRSSTAKDQTAAEAQRRQGVKAAGFLQLAMKCEARFSCVARMLDGFMYSSEDHKHYRSQRIQNLPAIPMQMYRHYGIEQNRQCAHQPRPSLTLAGICDESQIGRSPANEQAQECIEPVGPATKDSRNKQQDGDGSQYTRGLHHLVAHTKALSHRLNQHQQFLCGSNCVLESGISALYDATLHVFYLVHFTV